MLPTFVIAGAQKCGTTSLALALREHPQIFMPERKELHYFDRNFERGQEWYESWFAPASDREVLGEATPAYMFDPVARGRLIETLPDAQVIVILRNPVDRAYSHFWHKRRLGHEALETFEEAIAAEPRRRRSTRLRRRNGLAYLARGHYAEQLEPLLGAFGRDRVHVALLEDFIVDQRSALASVLGFLGLDPAGAADLEVLKSNPHRVPDETGELVPVDYEPMAVATRRRLTQTYDASVARLEELLGRDLGHWRQV